MNIYELENQAKELGRVSRLSPLQAVRELVGGENPKIAPFCGSGEVPEHDCKAEKCVVCLEYLGEGPIDD